ncbi:mitochondrial nucleoid-associated protein 1 [Channa argus]|uniref:mitochondrial nucleoid-associated protein 1 n=1 Tax=Channa argus TaxID=215402 RepID=UPI0029446703|nr:hypothetical protein Q8A73_021048 [Channa argus]
MTSEVCPFCGKTYKRLKSHLPYCKAAASSKTAPTQRDATAKETSSSQLATALSQTTPKGKKSIQTPSVSNNLQTKKSKTVCVMISEPSSLPTSATSPKSVNTASLSPSLRSASLPPPANKKRQKLVDQIKMANMLSASATVSLISSSPPIMSEPKNKSLHALKEAAKPKHISKGSLEGTRSAPEGLLSHLSASTTAQTKINSDINSVRDVGLLTNTKPREVPKNKRPKTKKSTESSSTTKTAPDSLDVNINETSTKPHAGDLMVDNEAVIYNVPESKTFLKSRSSHQAGITLQDVKATLRRAKAKSQSSRMSILSQLETVDEVSSLSPVIVPAERQRDGCVGTTNALSDVLLSSSSQHVELLSNKNRSWKSDHGSSVPLPDLQPKRTSPTAPLLSDRLSSQVSHTAACSHRVSTNDGLKPGHHMTALLSLSPLWFSSPHPFLLPPPVTGGTSRADEGSSAEKSQLDVVKHNPAHSQTGGALTKQRLGQVRLRELPEWLACKSPRNPRDVVEMVQRGWQWYHRRYIDVKKGGVGGLGMLLAGYCVLSYIWSYPRIKHERWRKYH